MIRSREHGLRARAAQSGMSAIPFIVALVLILVFVALWYNASKDQEQLTNDARKARAEAAEARGKLQLVSEEYLGVTEATGFSGTSVALKSEGYPSRARMQEGLKAWLDKARVRLTLEFDTTKYAPTGEGGRIEALGGDKVRVHYLPDASQMGTPTFESVLPLIEQAMARMQVDIQRAFEGYANAVKAQEETIAQHATQLATKDTRITELQGEIQTQRNAAEEQARELRDQIASLTAQKDQVQSELEAFRTQTETQVKGLETQVAQAQGQIRILTTREAPVLSEGPDGEVLASGPGIAIVNRGRKDWLMPGTVFTVLGRAKGGSLYPKGTIKITSVDDESSRGAIIEERPGDPIGRGDLVQSGTYSPSRKLHFHLVGEFRRLGKSQTEARLRSLGAVVDEAVTPETHYLVVGMPGPGTDSLEETEAYKTAKDLNITILTEEQLASFTRF